MHFIHVATFVHLSIVLKRLLTSLLNGKIYLFYLKVPNKLKKKKFTFNFFVCSSVSSIYHMYVYKNPNPVSTPCLCKFV